MTAPIDTEELRALLDGLEDRGAHGCIEKLHRLAPTLAEEHLRLAARNAELLALLDQMAEAADELHRDLLCRAEMHTHRETGEQYPLVSAGRSAWAGLCGSLDAYRKYKDKV